MSKLQYMKRHFRLKKDRPEYSVIKTEKQYFTLIKRYEEQYMYMLRFPIRVFELIVLV